MRTFLLPKDFSPRSPFTIEGERFHYLARVLRLAEGDSFFGTDREGRRHLMRIVEMQEHEMTLEAEEAPSNAPKIAPANNTANDPESTRKAQRERPEIHLYQCLLKGKKMDTVIRQAVEAGVGRIIPIESEYTIPRYDGAKEEKKRQRWETVAREAVQQSGSRVITEIAEPMEMSKLPKLDENGELGLFFHQEPLEQTPLHRYLSQYPKRVAVAIGPEGGFSRDEIGLLAAAGFSPVYLETNVLRAETAAVYALGAVQTILTERAFWNPKGSSHR